MKIFGCTLKYPSFTDFFRESKKKRGVRKGKQKKKQRRVCFLLSDIYFDFYTLVTSILKKIIKISYV